MDTRASSLGAGVLLAFAACSSGGGSAPDASCGEAAQVCCNGGACNAGLQCFEMVCILACGSIGESCCSGTCAAGLACQDALCVIGESDGAGGQGCTMDSDCSNDQSVICVASRCVENICASDAQCPAGEACSPLLSQCEATDAGPGDGDTDAGPGDGGAGDGGAGCTTKYDCMLGQACIAGTCQAPPVNCFEDDQCARGQVCAFGQTCVPGCDSYEDCPATEACNPTSFLCTPCGTGIPCGAGEACVGGACEQCGASVPCPEGEICWAGACRPTACEPGEECSSAADCCTTEICEGSDNTCAQTCSTAGDCPEGEPCCPDAADGGVCSEVGECL